MNPGWARISRFLPLLANNMGAVEQSISHWTISLRWIPLPRNLTEGYSKAKT